MTCYEPKVNLYEKPGHHIQQANYFYIFLLKRYFPTFCSRCFRYPNIQHFVKRWLFFLSKGVKKNISAKVEDMPLIRNKPPKLQRLRAPGVPFVEFSNVFVDLLWNHSVSSFANSPFSRSFSIAHDMSWTKGEPLRKTWTSYTRSKLWEHIITKKIN